MIKRDLKKLICSMLIGDGSIYYSGNKENPSLYFSMTHCRRQKDYLTWKVNLIEEIFKQKKIEKSLNIKDYIKKLKDKTFPVSTFSIGWKYFLKDIYEKSYPKYLNERKNIKHLLENMDEDVNLAIWLGDDGNEDRSYTKSRNDKNIKYPRSPRYRLSVYGFTDGEINLSIDWFKAKYNITPRRSEQAGGPILRFNVRDTRFIFHKIIKPYFSNIESMKNKFRWSFKNYCLTEEQTASEISDEDTVQTTTSKSLD